MALTGGGGLSRRKFLQRGGMAAAGAMALPAVAACGGSSTATTTSGSSAGTPKRGGTLRVGFGGASSSDTQDPIAAPTWIQIAYGQSMFDQLTNTDFNGVVVPSLAESLEPNSDSTVWTIRVKPDIEFHNGKPFGADDVMFSLIRMKTSPTSTAGFNVGAIDLAGMKKLDALTVRVPMKTPYSILPQGFAVDSVMIMPVGFDPHHPIGTGAFKHVSFTPGVEAVFAANPNWFGGFEQQKGGPYVDELRIIDINDDNARVNALQSGEVDAICGVPYGQVSTVQANPNLQLFTTKADVFYPFTMRVDIPPFHDVRVRQAMRLIANRPQMVANALSGHGRIANDLYSTFDPLSSAQDFPQRQQDLEQAKSLLKAAGQSNLKVTQTTSELEPGIVNASEVFASQASQAGVTVNLNQVDPGVFYGKAYLSYVFGVDYFDALPYGIQALVSDVPGAIFNTTHWNDPQYEALFAAFLRTQDEALRKQQVHDMQAIQYERGGYMVWGFADTLDAGTSHVHGFKPHPSGHNFGYESYWRLWLD